MKIAVIGAGAIGSLIGGYLTKAGEDVLLVGRESQVNAICQKGLCIKHVDREERISIHASTQFDHPYDLVLFAVKTQDMEQAYQDHHEYLEDCLIMTSQNGVQSDNLISCHFEPEKMISSIVMFGATYIKPGEIVYNFPGDWIIGKPYTPNDQSVLEIAQKFKEVFPIVISEDIIGMKWLKLFINFNNCLPALIGKSMQETFSDKDFCRLSILLLREGLDIIQKAQIRLTALPHFPLERILGLAALPMDQAVVIINKTLTTLSTQPVYGSILQSILRKKVSEIDFINGEVVCVAQNMKIPCPLNQKVAELVHQVEREGRFFNNAFIKKSFNL